MAFAPDSHRRRSIRLRGYDYAGPGAYFVTLCVQGRECLFGAVRDGEMVPNEAGRMVEAVWRQLPMRFSHTALDVFVVMPNHFHGILTINAPVGAQPEGAQPEGAQPFRSSTSLVGGGSSEKTMHLQADNGQRAGTRPAPTVGDIIGAFKSLTTNAYIDAVRENAWPPFVGRLWQRNYYERVIRDERELALARQYIADNPTNWPTDKENPTP